MSFFPWHIVLYLLECRKIVVAAGGSAVRSGVVGYFVVLSNPLAVPAKHQSRPARSTERYLPHQILLSSA